MSIEQRLKEYEPLINKLSYDYNVMGYTPDDLKQEFRIILMTCHKNYDESKALFSTYFVNSCNNFIKRVYRDNGRKPKVYYTIDDDMNEDEESHLIPAEEPEKTPLLDILATLPNGAISILLLQGSTQQEVAEKYGISQRTVGNKHNENIKIMKQLLERSGVGV